MILNVGFGYDFAALRDSENPVAQAYYTISDHSLTTFALTLLVALYPIVERIPFSWIKQSDVAKQRIVKAAKEVVETKTVPSQGSEKDILDCMLQENSRLESIGEQGLSKDEMIDQIMTFLAAGYVPFESTNRRHETTSTAMGWVLYELSEHPDVQTRLRKEIHQVLGTQFDPSNPPTPEQLDQMKYLNNVCREVLRVDPPGTHSHPNIINV